LGSYPTRRLTTILGILIAVVALYYLADSLVSGVRGAGSLSSLLSFDPYLFILSFLAVNLHLIAAAWSWQVVCSAAGHPISLRQAYVVHYLSQIGKYVPGKVWAAIGKVGLSRRIGMPGIYAGHALVLESIFIAAGCLLVTLPVVPAASTALGLGTWSGIGAVAAGIFLLLSLAHPRTFAFLMRLAARVTGKKIDTVRTGFGTVLRLIPVYLVVFLSLGFSFVLLAWSFGLDLPLFPGMFIFPAAMGIGYVVVFSPGGLGIREVSLVWLIELVFPAAEPGLPELLSIASRLWITFAEGLSFLLSVFLWQGSGSALDMIRRVSRTNGDDTGEESLPDGDALGQYRGEEV
jgi:uncharacterized membrane protein YbhN (UPF0104 family)